MLETPGPHPILKPSSRQIRTELFRVKLEAPSSNFARDSEACNAIAANPRSLPRSSSERGYPRRCVTFSSSWGLPPVSFHPVLVHPPLSLSLLVFPGTGRKTEHSGDFRNCRAAKRNPRNERNGRTESRHEVSLLVTTPIRRDGGNNRDPRRSGWGERAARVGTPSPSTAITITRTTTASRQAQETKARRRSDTNCGTRDPQCCRLLVLRKLSGIPTPTTATYPFSDTSATERPLFLSGFRGSPLPLGRCSHHPYPLPRPPPHLETLGNEQPPSKTGRVTRPTIILRTCTLHDVYLINCPPFRTSPPFY